MLNLSIVLKVTVMIKEHRLPQPPPIQLLFHSGFFGFKGMVICSRPAGRDPMGPLDWPMALDRAHVDLGIALAHQAEIKVGTCKKKGANIEKAQINAHS